VGALDLAGSQEKAGSCPNKFIALYTIRMVKSRMRKTGHVVRVREMRNSYKPEGKKPVGAPRH
jgi:hypothetical protein